MMGGHKSVNLGRGKSHRPQGVPQVTPEVRTNNSMNRLFRCGYTETKTSRNEAETVIVQGKVAWLAWLAEAFSPKASIEAEICWC